MKKLSYIDISLSVLSTHEKEPGNREFMIAPVEPEHSKLETECMLQIS